MSLTKRLEAAVTYAGVPEALATAASTIVGKRTRTNIKATKKATRPMALNKRSPRKMTTSYEVMGVILENYNTL